MKRSLIGAAATLALAACGRGDAPGAANGQVGADGPPAMTIVTNEGRAEIRTGGSAGANLPDGIPAYPGADMTGGMTISGASADGGAGAMSSFRTADSPAEVLDFYAAAAERAGYRIEGRMTMGPNATLTAARDGGGFHVNAIRGADGTMVQLISSREGVR